MSSFTMDAAPRYPSASTVLVYPEESFVNGSGPTQPLVTSATVSATGLVTFSGLEDDRRYFAAQNQSGRWVLTAFRVGTSDPQNLAEAVIALNLVESDVAEVFAPESAVLKTAAPFVTGRMRLRDQWTARDFGATGNGDEFTAELTEGIHETRAAGRVLHVSEGVYGADTQLTTDGEQTPLAIKGAGKVSTKIEYTGNGAAIKLIGQENTVVTTLTAPAAIGANSITVASTAGFAQGDLVILRDLSVNILGLESMTGVAKRGEYRKIRSVDSGTQLTLYGQLTTALASATDVQKQIPVNGVNISDLSFVNPVPGTLPQGYSAAVHLVIASGINIRDVEFRDLDATGLRLQACWNFRLTDLDFYEIRDIESSAPYCIECTNGTQFGLVDGVKGHYVRHLFDVNTTDSGLAVCVQNVRVQNSMATSSNTAFSSHPGARNLTFANCHAFGGINYGGPAGSPAFQLRGPDCKVLNCTADGYTTGVYCVYGADRAHIQGGVYSNCDVGIDIDDTSDVRVRGVDIVDPVVAGVRIDDPTPAWAGHPTELSLRDVRVYGDPSSAAFVFDVWSNNYELKNISAPNATTKATGQQQVVVASANTLTLPRNSNFIVVTGTTQVNVILRDRTIGEEVTLAFTTGLTVKHNGGAGTGMLLKAGVDRVVGANGTMKLVLLNANYWVEV